MANYAPNSWSSGDTITKAKMDRLEAAAAAALPSADAPELIRDTIGTALVAGANVTITPNDAGDTITVAATGGGGSSSTPAALTDGATVALDASLGSVFLLSAAGNRTVLAPTNPANGKTILIAHTASGGARTLALTTGTAGAFRFGTSFTALSATATGTTDYIGCVYRLADQRWDVISYAKGF
jgi:hypothetical protein